MKKEEFNEEIIEKLKMIIGQELKYKELCSKLNLKYKGGEAKSHQLDQLNLYCELEVLSKPTKYIVKKVYDNAVNIFEQLHGNNKYQDLFEGAMYQALLNNNCKPLYMSNMEMLSLFNEVNENFSYCCNEYYMGLLGGSYLTLNEMSQIAYKILREWTKRRMRQMEARKVILTRQGFRLYSKINQAYIIYNVDIDSEKEKMCQEIYDRAAKEVLPEDWHGEWVQAWRWEKFEERIKELVYEYSHGDYCDLKPITIISPPREEYLIEILNKIYNKIPELQEINKEAVNKIFNTTQLNKFSGEDRVMLIDISIKENPQVLLKNKIKEVYKRKEEG